MHTLLIRLIILVGALCPRVLPGAKGDLLIQDFEAMTGARGRSLARRLAGPCAWHAAQPDAGDGFLGKGLVNSYHAGMARPARSRRPSSRFNASTSLPHRRRQDAEKTCMNLLIDGKAVRNATGPNDKPGGSETLVRSFGT